MLVKLTLSPEKTELYLRIVDIMVIRRNPENQLQTVVITCIMTNKGPMSYVVQEAPSEVANQMLSGGYNKVTQ